MKCPIILAGWNAARGGDLVFRSECRKEECAWWINNSQQCAINKLGAELYVIGEVLEEIRDKMPHEKERLV